MNTSYVAFGFCWEDEGVVAVDQVRCLWGTRIYTKRTGSRDFRLPGSSPNETVAFTPRLSSTLTLATSKTASSWGR